MLSVKTTRIEKHYKDKKTGQLKMLTIDYAKVKDRLLAFWEDNPKGAIETSPVPYEGKTMFKCSVIKDQSDQYSQKATGHALEGDQGEKSFEKLETIAVGRALALLGYAVTGEIASSEEMEKFYAYKAEKKEEAMTAMRAATTLDELKKIYLNLGSFMGDPDILALKDSLKLNLK